MTYDWVCYVVLCCIVLCCAVLLLYCAVLDVTHDWRRSTFEVCSSQPASGVKNKDRLIILGFLVPFCSICFHLQGVVRTWRESPETLQPMTPTHHSHTSLPRMTPTALVAFVGHATWMIMADMASSSNPLPLTLRARCQVFSKKSLVFGSSPIFFVFFGGCPGISVVLW